MRNLNKYATMYDNLKAIYGDELDVMIAVIYETENSASQKVKYGKTRNQLSVRKPLLYSMLAGSAIGYLVLFVAAIGGDDDVFF